MRKWPRLLVLGRPNVGKSTLVNRLIRKKLAVISDEPGVTRDVSEYPVVWKDKPFVLMDSGGILLASVDDIYLQGEIERKVLKAIDRADHVVFLMDYQTGLHAQDRAIAQLLRQSDRPVTLAVNKLDNPDMSFDLGEFYDLGLGEPIGVSSTHGHGVDRMMSQVTSAFSMKDSDEYDDAFRIAIVGQPNVGKSSLVNAILNEDRVIVDDKAGTTRDSVEAYFTHHDQRYVFVDTAGIQKKAKKASGVEYYSYLRAHRSIHEADLVLLVVGLDKFITDQEKKIINAVQEQGKSMIVVVNKWDLTERTDQERRDLERVAYQTLPFLVNYPFVFLSATEKLNLGNLFKAIPEVLERSRVRYSTSELNQFIQNVIRRYPPPAKYGKHVKIYYATQINVAPPTFVFFINHPKYLEEDYKRYLEKRLREYFGGMLGVTVRFYFRKHRD